MTGPQSALAKAAPLALLTALGLLLAHRPARADDATSQATPSLFQQDTLSGDWGGARKHLSDDGVILGADEIFDALGNPTGGLKQGLAFEGRFELFANVDLGAAAGWKGAILHANAYQIHGRGLSTDDVGNPLTVSNTGATPATRLFTLWLQQSLFDDTLSVRLGQIAADDEFFVSQYAALFINSTFGWPSILGINLPSGGPAYPLATPGLRAKLALSPAFTLSSAVFNGDPAPPGPGDPQIRDAGGTAFRLNGGTFWINEIAYSSNLALLGDNVPGTYKLGAWYHNGLFADQRFDANGRSLANPLSSSVPASRQGNFGGYFILDQLIRRNSGSSDTGLGAFLRAGADPADRNLIEFHADAGFNYAGLLPGRDNDVAGIAISYERIGSARRDLVWDLEGFTGLTLPPADFESAIELSYQAQIAPWWVAQPDLQIILHPDARLPNLAAPSSAVLANALLIGMRTAISF